MTELSVAETEVVLRRDKDIGDSWPPLSPDDSEVDEDMAGAPLPNC